MRTLPPTRLEPLTAGFHQRAQGLLRCTYCQAAMPSRIDSAKACSTQYPCVIH